MVSLSMVWYLYLGPVLVCTVFVPQRTCGGPLVAHEGIRDGCSLHRVAGGQVHDDADLKGRGQKSKHEGDKGSKCDLIRAQNVSEQCSLNTEHTCKVQQRPYHRRGPLTVSD